MKVIKRMIMLALICYMNNVNAQEVPAVEIGGRLPNVDFKMMGNKTVNSNLLLQKKLLIVDFWATWCVPCLVEIELLDSIKKQHPNALEVVMITTEDSTVVNKFFKKYPHYKSPRINYVTNDTYWRKVFPHQGLPHNVWIDSKGTVKAITDTREVNLKNILGFDQGSAAGMYVKKDILNFDVRERLDILNDNFIYRSIFGPKKDGIPGQSLIYGPLNSTGNQYTFINAILSGMLYEVYKFGSHKDQLLEIITKDSLKFYMPEGKQYKHLLVNSRYKDVTQWEKENSHCYQLVLPKKVPIGQLKQYAYQDLERRFNLKIEEVLAPREVIEVKQQAGVYTLEKGSTDYPSVSFMPGNKLKIKNATPQQVFEWFFTMHSARVVPLPYVVDSKETGVINTEIDFSSFLKEANKEGIDRLIFEKGMTTLGFTFETKVRDYKILRVIDLENQ